MEDPKPVELVLQLEQELPEIPAKANGHWVGKWVYMPETPYRLFC